MEGAVYGLVPLLLPIADPPAISVALLAASKLAGDDGALSNLI
jgi:hypothetical protein